MSSLAVATDTAPSSAQREAGGTIPAVVLGGSGYVAGELLRLLAGHPVFRVEAVVSESRSGEPVVDTFPHLRGSGLDALRFAAGTGSGAGAGASASGGSGEAVAGAVAAHERLALFSALPHGEAAARIDAVLSAAEAAGSSGVRVVDLSADFRHRSPERYAAIYGKPHPAPRRLREFLCTVPELHRSGTGDATLPDGVRHVAHPGCFTTAATLALAPFVAGGWIEPRATVVAITGSTGAGRTPTATTHHPERRSDLFSYSPLVHRHEPEMQAILARFASNAPSAPSAAITMGATSVTSAPEIFFVPHAGPFARGIHATISARLAHPVSVEDLKSSVFPFYGSLSSLPVPSSLPLTKEPLPLPFVQFQDASPHLQSVVGTNRCDLSFAVRGGELVIFAALDNLVKGAAGGAVQWMNRLFALPESAGLALPGLGWL